MLVRLRLNDRELRPHKAVTSPKFGSPTVLTNDPWTFVSLYLTRAHQPDALFFWQQAREFYRASEGLPLQSAPLLLYYTYLNATKALLTARGVPFSPLHGVKETKAPLATGTGFDQIAIKIQAKGVLPSLSQYFNEVEPDKVPTLQSLFFNLPLIHRTYALTYPAQQEMFIPLRDVHYVLDDTTGRARLSATLSADISAPAVFPRLPPTFMPDPSVGPAAICSAGVITIGDPLNPPLVDLTRHHRQMREDMFYINGAQTLWYLRGRTPGPPRIARQIPTMIFAAMHRLSEICRYNPTQLLQLLQEEQNWLISEFITMSASQFIDMMAAEITGQQLMTPNIRPAT